MLLQADYAEQNLLMASLLLTIVLPMLSVITLPPDPLILAASSGSDLNGAAVLRACEAIRDRMAAVAEDALGSGLRFAEGHARRRDASRRKSIEGPEPAHPISIGIVYAESQRVRNVGLRLGPVEELPVHPEIR